MEKVRLPSYAKINLGLEILGKRDDGYHEIATILQQIDLKDDIELVDRGNRGVNLRCDAEALPRGDQNLCVRAAKLLIEEFGLARGVDIMLHKQIPVGAGLGGGSSNAAVVLLGLNKIWNLRLSREELTTLASKLGSDVPFFIEGGSALARGRGEILEPARIDFDFWVLILFPGFEISTEWLYKRVNLNLTNRNKIIKFPCFKGFVKFEDFRQLNNDLEAIAFKHYPVLLSLKEGLYRCKAFYASMSGSGSAMYGLFDSREEALKAKEHFQGLPLAYIARPVVWGYERIN